MKWADNSTEHHVDEPSTLAPAKVGNFWLQKIDDVLDTISVPITDTSRITVAGLTVTIKFPVKGLHKGASFTLKWPDAILKDDYNNPVFGSKKYKYCNSSKLKTFAPTATVTGSLELTVSNATEFISDQRNKEGVKRTMASITGISKENIEVTLSLGQRRRLDETAVRLLAAGNIIANFAISIPQTSSVPPTNVADAIASTSVQVMMSKLNTQIQSLGGSPAVVGVSPIARPVITSHGTIGDTASASESGHRGELLATLLMMSFAMSLVQDAE
jgi:hypothetical protein